MEKLKPLEDFLERIENDSRIRMTHIAVYITLYQNWITNDCPEQILVTSKIMMQLAKISSSATWHRAIKGLHEYGYIEYKPTFNKMEKSKAIIPIKR